MKNELTTNAVVSHSEWLSRRKELLVQEKELTDQRDRVAALRRALPWVRVDKDYVFDSVHGTQSLADLFDGRSQLIVQHFMFAPGWAQGCPSCSFMADHTDGMRIHLENRDVSFVAISRATLPEIERFRARMGWQFNWVSSNKSDFNYDFNVSFPPQEDAAAQANYNFSKVDFSEEEMPGISVFFKNEAGEIFRTYSAYARGVEAMMGTYAMLDLVPHGRGERDVPHKMEWVRHHDRYEPKSQALHGKEVSTHSQQSGSEAADRTCCGAKQQPPTE
ncbi:DUF899 domain-containing protein [Ottowia thiooxydans]|uniref:Dithiol-disulfide oxidoreductase (DUF899 family) n=1 Tax=Ottowia thiooxydans TaxID=219182 RepID=A0ABV2Q381_9BURK